MEGFSQDETSTLSDAFGRLEKFEKVNFDETIELSSSLGVDTRMTLNTYAFRTSCYRQTT